MKYGLLREKVVQLSYLNTNALQVFLPPQRALTTSKGYLQMATSNHTSNIPYGYCQCGCGQKTKRHPKGGYCLYIRGHKPIELRFWEKVIKSESDDECWIWTAGRNKAGYGKVNRKSYPSQIASRTAWVFTYGSIPKGLDVLHKCDNPACVNPNHLFLGTELDNVRDMYAKGRQSSNKGEKNPRSKLNWNDIHYIRTRYAQGGISYVKLGKQMGVDAAQIYRIINNITWKENGGNKK